MTETINPLEELQSEYLDENNGIIPTSYRESDDDPDRPPFEPSHDTDRYKEWELKEQMIQGILEINEEIIKNRR